MNTFGGAGIVFVVAAASKRAKVPWWVCWGVLAAAGCGPLQLPGRAANAIADERQHCVECSLRDGTAQRGDAQAASDFQRWCARGDAASCSALGVMYETGRGLAQDLARAEALFQRACQRHNATACVNLGRLLARRDADHADHAAEAIVFEMACAQGELDGCFELGRSHHAAGRSAAAAALFDSSCRAGHSASCEMLGVMFARGTGLTRDTARARALFRRACLGGKASACERLGQRPPASVTATAL